MAQRCAVCSGVLKEGAGFCHACGAPTADSSTLLGAEPPSSRRVPLYGVLTAVAVLVGLIFALVPTLMSDDDDPLEQTGVELPAIDPQTAAETKSQLADEAGAAVRFTEVLESGMGKIDGSDIGDCQTLADDLMLDSPPRAVLDAAVHISDDLLSDEIFDLLMVTRVLVHSCGESDTANFDSVKQDATEILRVIDARRAQYETVP